MNTDLSAVERGSPLHESYTAAASDGLHRTERVQAARDRWASYYRASHGNVFERVDADDPVDSLFVDTLYYDFVVRALLDSLQEEYDCTLVNAGPDAETAPLAVPFRSIHRLVDEVSSVDLGNRSVPIAPTELDTGDIRRLSETIASDELRGQLGEYYTPRGLTDLAVETLDIADYASETFLDPGCGSGSFLAACIDAKREALAESMTPAELVEVITGTVFGIDLNPTAVTTAKLQYLSSLGDLVEQSTVEEVTVPVFAADSLGLNSEHGRLPETVDAAVPVDHLVGNPPWITWGALPEDVRAAWRERHVDRLGLFPHRGMESRLGHGNDDISVPFVWVCLDRYLADGGDAAVVLKRAVTKGPAGRLFRSGAVDGQSVAVERIHDFPDLRPFGAQADVGSALYTLRLGGSQAFPVETRSWTRGDAEPEFSTRDRLAATLQAESTGVVPVAEQDPSDSWVRADAADGALGPCQHTIRHGVKDDAKSVYTVDRDQLDTLEPDHVYPYLRSKHIVKYGLFGYDLHLVPMEKANKDNESTLRSQCPATYQYLASNRDRLEGRSSTWLDGGPFYNVFGLGAYTWAPYKVVWCRLGFKPHFAVVSTVPDDDLGEKPVVPGDHCMFVGTDSEREAHFLCGLLNSGPYQDALTSLADGGKSGLSKSVVSRLALPAYRDTPRHRQIATLSMEAHDIVPEYTDTSKRTYNKTSIEAVERIQATVDATVETLLSTGDEGSR